MDTQSLYRNYVSTHFRGSGKLTRENLEMQIRYFHENYLQHLPKDRESRIVDLGSGLGHFLHFLQSEGFTNIQGVDVAAECAAHCRAQGLSVAEDEITVYLRRLADPVDVFVLNDVLEHQTKDQMWELLGLVQKRLRPGGTLLVKVPNLAQPILGSDSRYLDITHETGFTEHSLDQALQLSGFSPVEVFAPNIYVFKGVKNWAAMQAAGWLNRLWRVLFKLYGRTATTIFSKHLLAVARKS